MSVLGNAKTPQQVFRQTFNQPSLNNSATDQANSFRRDVNSMGGSGVVGKATNVSTGKPGQ